MNQADRFYIFITVFLVIAMVVGGVMLLINRGETQPEELVLSQSVLPQPSGEIYIDGAAVINPGIYPLWEGDTIQELLSDVRLETGATLDYLQLYVLQEGEKSSQKIDINRAEAWLLDALKGIGETRALAIVTYRNENGEFKRIEDLLKVEGIGEGTFEKISNNITVSE